MTRYLLPPLLLQFLIAKAQDAQPSRLPEAHARSKYVNCVLIGLFYQGAWLGQSTANPCRWLHSKATTRAIAEEILANCKNSPCPSLPVLARLFLPRAVFFVLIMPPRQ